MEHACRKCGVSEREACRVLKQWRGTQRYVPLVRADENALTRDIIAPASEYGRFGYRRITALLQARGWPVGRHAAFQRIASRLVEWAQNWARWGGVQEAGGNGQRSKKFHTKIPSLVV